MRLAVAALLVAAAAVACGSAASAPAKPATSLSISFWEQGRGTGGADRWTLQCEPTGGTHPKRAAACRKLLALRAPFAPPPRDLVCTQIYGGPEQALVTGTHRGQKVWTLLTLRDGCAIDRFKRLGFLVPGFSVGSGGSSTR